MDASTYRSDMGKARQPIEINVIAATAQDVTQHFELQKESQRLLTAAQTPADFLQILRDNSHHQDAVIFLAHALPIRDAVWWACMCAREHLDNCGEQYRQALTAAEAWVREPTEENRRKAEKAAEAGNYATPASWAAAAAFWSGDNIAPAAEAAMEPPAGLHAQAAGAAIVMSAGLEMPPEEIVVERYRRYLQQGIDIANNGSLPVND